MTTLTDKVHKHLSMLPPHVKERQTVKLLVELLEEYESTLTMLINSEEYSFELQRLHLEALAKREESDKKLSDIRARIDLVNFFGS